MAIKYDAQELPPIPKRFPKETLKETTKEKTGEKTMFDDFSHFEEQAEVKDNIFLIPNSPILDLAAIGLRMKEVRNKLGLGGEELALLTDISNTALRKIETGQLWPPHRCLISLYEKFHVDIMWLLFGVTSNRQKVLSAFSGMNDEDLFDLFIRLFSYFTMSDAGAFDSNNGKIGGVSDFAKWDQVYYRALTAEEAQELQKQSYHEYKSVPTESLDNIKELYASMSGKDRKQLMEFFRSIDEQ